jgi:hypothetical protein
MSRIFKVTKELHLVTLQAFIKAYSKSNSFVVDLFISINIYIFSPLFAFVLIKILFFTNVFVVGNIVRACHNLDCHILALEGDNGVFSDVLKLFCEHDIFKEDDTFEHK